MTVTYPLFALERDDGSMSLIESEDCLFYHLEEIDVENGEYLFWDADGNPVGVILKKKRPATVVPTAGTMSIEEGFAQFLQSLGLPASMNHGAPLEIWERIQSELQKRPSKRSLLHRFFPR